MGVQFCRILFQHLTKQLYGVFFQFIYMMHYIDRFLYVEPAPHLWDEAYLIVMDYFLICSWIRFARILLRIFVSLLMSVIGL